MAETKKPRDINYVSHIELLGSPVFLLEAVYPEYASYLVNGFEKPIIKVNDFRKVGIKALGCFLCNQDEVAFNRIFCSPARISIIERDKEIIVELKDTKKKTPDYQLWIAIGIRGSIPAFDYLFIRDVHIRKNCYGILALYKRP